MRLAKIWTVLLLTCCVLVVSGTALAATVRVDDPAGDGLDGHRLDITTVKIDNRDHAIVVDVSFVRAAHGQFGVAFMARGDTRKQVAAVTSAHRAGADTNKLRTVDGVQKCRGLEVTWHDDANDVHVRLPARCFRRGNYGAIRATVGTVIGSDTDTAPNDASGHWRWTRWVSRG